MRRLIESTNFPLEVVNKASYSEKQGGGRPPPWEMIFWWTRKPLSSARAIISASILPEDVNLNEFLNRLKLNERSPHRHNPELKDWGEMFRNKKLLDPFAGFGNIPLEALRLGMRVHASELLPVAYVLLKAILKYPRKYGNTLARDLEKWGKHVIEKLRRDPEIRELYDEEVSVYIGSWEVKCLNCGRWTPLIGNYWLARTKDSSGRYKRLAYMYPVIKENKVEIGIKDLNEELKVPGGEIHRVIRRVDPKRGLIEVEGKGVFEVPRPNVEARRNNATCLLCGSNLRFVDQHGNHYPEKKGRKNLEWYVKWALKKYNEGDERFARQRLLVKVKVVNGDLVFEPCCDEDQEKLERAKEYVKELIEKSGSDVPTEPVAYYQLQPPANFPT
ncbi:MAG TPA: DUF1156 domain-containing protein, partial [Euryarchaeota archaeon]|nr:DUF1156 domain-containing protein [Euryarchaeota archaeon]